MIDALYTNFKTNIVNSINECMNDFEVPDIFLKQAENDPEIVQRHSKIQPASILTKNRKTFPFSNILIGCYTVLSDFDALAKCRVHHELKLKDRTNPLLKYRTQELKRKQTEGLKNVPLFPEKFEILI